MSKLVESPLFERGLTKPHLLEVHTFWEKIVQEDDLVIDATCGNGYDTAKLATLAATVVAIDIQEEALQSAQQIATSDNIVWIHGSHATFPNWIEPETVSLIAYNLGYLPGGDKTLTTISETTLESVKNGLSLLKPQGALTIVCYPGHPEGEVEEKELLHFFKTLKSHEWLISYTTWPNRKRHPSLIKVIKLEPFFS